MDKVCAVIVAAGKGKRMGAGKNKQFIEICGRPVLYYTLDAFQQCGEVDEIVLVCAPGETEYVKEEILARYGFSKVKAVVPGGAERQYSVYNGIKAAGECGVVLIHDGARPFVSPGIISDGVRHAREHGAAACGVVPKDTIKLRDESGFSAGTLERSSLFSVQTPQCFRLELIAGCYEKAISGEIIFTDDTSVAEHFGHEVFLYEGSYDNIKITTPEDIYLSEVILAKLKK
jgi:2-C-methyl-D-erythritol 4-phosphate cytidylyltransferase